VGDWGRDPKKRYCFVPLFKKDKKKIKSQDHDVEQSFVDSSDENIGKCADTNPHALVITSASHQNR